MAKVFVRVVGSASQMDTREASSPRELLSQLNLSGYSVQIDGEPADLDSELEEGDKVVFSVAAKGNC